MFLMIRTCTDSIQDSTQIIKPALTGLMYPFDLTPDSNELFSISLDTSQSIYIKIIIADSSNTSSIVFVNIISKNTLDTVRSIKLRNSTVITSDLDMGDYYICVRTLLGEFSIEMTVDYLRYSRDVIFDNVTMFHGESAVLESLYIKRPEIACNQPLKYTLVGGSLPTGLQLDAKGRVYGTLPIIDNEDMKSFPSFNLYHSNFDYATPIGVRYEFTVKLELENGGDDTIFDIRNFCIMIVNDWSLTQPYLGAEIYDITGEVDDISKTLIPKTLCPPCVLTVDTNTNTASYVFDGDNSIILADIVDANTTWYYNDYGSISKDNYVSRTPIIKNIVQMDYVINAYESGNDDINVPTLESYSENEYIILPENIDSNNIYKWVVQNKNTLIESGYNNATLNKYIDKKLDGVVNVRNNRLNLDLIVDDSIINDPQIAFTQAHENILADEPMYIIGTFFPSSLYGEITYESYR